MSSSDFFKTTKQRKCSQALTKDTVNVNSTGANICSYNDSV